MTGRVVDIKRLAVHDGPGIRTTLFLKGCPLACQWCHNPETISGAPEIGFLTRRCTGCGRCVDSCPVHAHVIEDGRHRFDRTACIACEACVTACLAGALEFYGEEITATDAVAAVLEDRTFYDTSNGGCTLSGGEPLLQAEFCAEVCAELQAESIHCAIDTSGAVPWDRFECVLPHTDLFLYDLKHVDDDAHRQWTGAANQWVLENLRRLASMPVALEVRIPFVPGVNTSDSQLAAMGAFLVELADSIPVRIVPYHALARSKYEAVGKTSRMPDTAAPAPADVLRGKLILQACGLCHVTTPFG